MYSNACHDLLSFLITCLWFALIFCSPHSISISFVFQAQELLTNRHVFDHHHRMQKAPGPNPRPRLGLRGLAAWWVDVQQIIGIAPDPPVLKGPKKFIQHNPTSQQMPTTDPQNNKTFWGAESKISFFTVSTFRQPGMPCEEHLLSYTEDFTTRKSSADISSSASYTGPFCFLRPFSGPGWW